MSSVLLQESDFPDYFIDKHHPEDYKIKKSYTLPKFIFHKLYDRARLILCISIKVRKSFVPLTFICDTGAPSYIYLNDLSWRLIKDRIDEDDCIEIDNKKMIVRKSPTKQREVNILGLLFFSHFNLIVENDNFVIEYIPDFL